MNVTFKNYNKINLARNIKKSNFSFKQHPKQSIQKFS
jgi:hypothetical protein